MNSNQQLETANDEQKGSAAWQVRSSAHCQAMLSNQIQGRQVSSKDEGKINWSVTDSS